MVNLKGQIRKAVSGFYYVYAEGATFQTRGRGNFRKRNITPLVGDEVLFESDNPAEGYVLEILPRHNELVRPPVANVDLGVVVMSMVEPDFSFNLLDRFLVTLEHKGIQPVIFLTKVDLLNEEQKRPLLEIKRIYEAIGYTVLFANESTNNNAIEQLEALFAKRLTVFMGQSGAGKSTLLNKISPELHLATAEISESLGRGKHTTRHVELIPLYGGLVADTPGFSAIDFLEMTAIELPKQFPEFVAAANQCKFRECMHHKEPGCEVKEQVAEGAIAQSRYDNYLQFLMEIENRRPVYKKNKKSK